MQNRLDWIPSTNTPAAKTDIRVRDNRELCEKRFFRQESFFSCYLQYPDVLLRGNP
jgi:hypothetical protein